jgi:hypothetical protein
MNRCILHASTPPPGFRDNAGFTENRIEKPKGHLLCLPSQRMVGFVDGKSDTMATLTNEKRLEEGKSAGS